MVQTEIVREAIPEALIRDCPQPWSKPVKVTGDFIARGDLNEAALKKCRAQVAAIRKWNERP